MIIVFDASRLVSAALREGSVPEQALLLALEDQHQIIWSDDVFAEYRDVLSRSKFSKALPTARRDSLLDSVERLGLQIEPSIGVRECADPKDDKYLSLAAAGRATVIVSSDNHLLRLHPWRGIAILNPQNFIARAATAPG